MAEPTSPAPPGALRLLALSLFALMLVLAWDVSGLDLPLARWFGSAHGFALTHNWWLQDVLHTGARNAAWAVMALLVLAIGWPPQWLAALSRPERVGLVVGILLAVLAIQWLKRMSGTSCPWDLAEFGGSARYVPHWLRGVADGGGGHCFPAGHAAVGSGFLAGWFWLRPRTPRVARIWLAASLLLGAVLGGVQVVRGAHYLSHVLWTAWVCWGVGGAWWLAARAFTAMRKLDSPLRRWRG